MCDYKYSMTRPTHRCKICGAFWCLWSNSWSVLSTDFGECCDQKKMNDQIIKLVDYDENDQGI